MEREFWSMVNGVKVEMEVVREVLEFESVLMNNGKMFDGKKIGELTEYIISKFSDEGLSYDEAQIVLKQTEGTIGEFCLVQSLDRK